MMTPDPVWLHTRGQIETCHACGISFAMRPGESTSALVHRYTAWREAHAAPEPSEGDESSGSERLEEA